jgi:hypothetical protein
VSNVVEATYFWVLLIQLANGSSVEAGQYWRVLVAAPAGGPAPERAPGEALERYQAVRVRLSDELGVDPGSDLQRVYADLLADRVPAVTCRGCPLRDRSIAAAP